MDPELLDEAQQESLLAWARAHLEASFGGPLPEAQGLLVPLPEEVGGVFVTIKSGSELRGCIGYVRPELSLVDATRRAVTAAREDPRFPRVRAEETSRLRLTISILDTPKKLVDVRAIRIGRHGLLIQEGGARGLLLPQVAVEHGWDAERFLSECCRKAALPLDAWRRPTTELHYFEAFSFQEKQQD